MYVSFPAAWQRGAADTSPCQTDLLCKVEFLKVFLLNILLYYASSADVMGAREEGRERRKNGLKNRHLAPTDDR